MSETCVVCVVCGDSVAVGSGKFVNRIPADDGYICYECECKERREHPQYECADCGEINYIESGLQNDGGCWTCKDKTGCSTCTTKGSCQCGSKNWKNVDEDNEADVRCGQVLEEQLVQLSGAKSTDYGNEYWCTFQIRHNCKGHCCVCPECGSSAGYYKENCDTCFSCDMKFER